MLPVNASPAKTKPMAILMILSKFPTLRFLATT